MIFGGNYSFLDMRLSIIIDFPWILGFSNSNRRRVRSISMNGDIMNLFAYLIRIFKFGNVMIIFPMKMANLLLG